MWVKLAALTLLPLLAAGALCLVVVTDRLARTADSARIAQLAQLAERAYIVSDDAYFDGFILSAQADLGSLLLLVPSIRPVAHHGPGRAGGGPQQTGPVDRVLGHRKPGTAPLYARATPGPGPAGGPRLNRAKASRELVILAYRMWVVAEQSMSSIGAVGRGPDRVHRSGVAYRGGHGRVAGERRRASGTRVHLQRGRSSAGASPRPYRGSCRPSSSGRGTTCTPPRPALARHAPMGAGQPGIGPPAPGRRRRLGGGAAHAGHPGHVVLRVGPLAISFGSMTMAANKSQLATVAATANALCWAAVSSLRLTLAAMAALVLLTLVLMSFLQEINPCITQNLKF